MVLQTKLLVFLKQTQTRIIVNQENQKQKQAEDKIIKAKEGKIIKDIRNLIGHEENDYYKPVK